MLAERQQQNICFVNAVSVWYNLEFNQCVEIIVAQCLNVPYESCQLAAKLLQWAADIIQWDHRHGDLLKCDWMYFLMYAGRLWAASVQATDSYLVSRRVAVKPINAAPQNESESRQ